MERFIPLGDDTRIVGGNLEVGGETMGRVVRATVKTDGSTSLVLRAIEEGEEYYMHTESELENTPVYDAMDASLRALMGQVLHHHRKVEGLRLQDVADGSGLSLAFCSEIERGEKNPSSESLQAFCDAIGLPLQALLRETADVLDDAHGRE